MAQQAQPYGSPPREHGSSNSDVAREQGEQVKDEVTQQTQAVAGTVADEASHVAREAKGHVQDLAADAKQQLHRQGREQTDNLGGALDALGDRVHALAEGRPQDAGPVGDYADRIADQVDQLAARVSSLGFDGMVDEVQHFARRRPGVFLAGAAAAGFAVSRLGRGVQASQQEQGGSGSGARGESSAIQAGPSAASSRTSPPPISARPATGTTPPLTTPAPSGATPPKDPIAPPRDPGVSRDQWSSGEVRR